MKSIIENLKDLVEAAIHLNGAGVKTGMKVSSGGKVHVGKQYAGQRGDVIFVPESE